MVLISFIFALCLLITIHELGHYLVARCFNIQVETFSIGFGKAWWQYQNKNHTVWQITYLPIGGFVKLADSRRTTNSSNIIAKINNKTFNKASKLQRCLVYLAGPVFNLILAFMLFIIMYLLGPINIMPKVANGALPQGAVITQVEAIKVDNWQAVMLALYQRWGDTPELQLTIQHDNKTQQVSLAFPVDSKRYHNPLQALNIKPLKVKRHPELIIKKAYPLAQAIKLSLDYSYQILKFNAVILKKIITRKLPFSLLSGPIGLFLGAAKMSKHLTDYLNYLGLLSLGIAFINLLPYPGLDGGGIVYLGIEAVRGKAMSEALELLLLRLGMILLAVFTVQLVLNDLSKLLS